MNILIFGLVVILCGVGALSHVDEFKRVEENPWWRWKDYDVKENPARKALFQGIEPSIIDGIGWRLTNESRPIHYTIALTTNVQNNDRNFSGIAEIDLQIVQATTRICMNSLNLVFSEIVLSNLNTGAIVQSTYATDEPHEMLCITANTQLTLNTEYKVRVTYTGTINGFTGGFFISSYTNPSGAVVYYGATQFQPMDARLVFPCYDEPRFRATFNLSINHHNSVHAISNMPGQSTASGTDRIVTVFDQTPAMPSYLIAFAVTDFAYTSNNVGIESANITHRAFSAPHLVDTTEFGLVTGEQVLNALGNRFNVTYTLPKLDQIGITNFGGAMENWGLVIYQQSLLLVSNTSSISATETVGRIIAHELAHQWFGNLVTPDFWTYLWLSEGFATYYEYHGIDMVKPEWRTKDLFTVEVWQYAARYDLGQYRAMSRYVESASQVNSQFDFIAYDKSGVVIRMVINALGEDVYLNGIYKYFTENQNGVVEPRILYDALQRAANEIGNLPTGVTVADFFDSWATQSGYPVVTAYRLDEINTIVFVQQAYTGEPNNSPLTWWIPFNMVTSQNPNFTSTTADGWIAQGQRMMQYVTPQPLNSFDWIIVNKEQTGYYRVNYDDYNWKLIAEAMQFSNAAVVVPPVTRAQLLDDAFVLSQDGFMNLRTALDMYNYLYVERDYVPWIVANRHMTTLQWKIRGQQYFGQFETMIMIATSVQLMNLGYNVIPNEPHIDTKFRRIIMYWNCFGGSYLCQQNALEQLNAEMNGTATIHSELRTTVECFGVRAGGRAEFDYFVNRAISTLSINTMLPLTCSRSYEILNPFVADMFNPNSNLNFNQRQNFVIQLLTNSYFGYTLVLDYCFENMDRVLASDIVGYWLFQYLALEISNESHFNRLVAVFAMASPTFNPYSFLAYAEENIRWLNTYGSTVEDWVYSQFLVSGSEKVLAPIAAIFMGLLVALKSMF